jgi:serine/threonine protein phosphatase PrpC
MKIIADVFAVLARRNSSILVLADGVNWGPRSRLAARCAVRACMNYINRNLFYPINSNYDQLNSNYFSNYPNKCLTTHDVFKIMCRGFDAAQEFILQKKGTMTTLCCSVVVKLRDSLATAGTSNSLWAVCTLSIGDSTAYVYNRSRGVFELTYGARNLNDERDMRNVGGALGHVYGIKPDVSNLNYSVMYIRENDIVFLVSDGVSDNLDPCVSQTARKKSTEIPNEILADNNNRDKSSSSNNNGFQKSLSQSFKKKSASRESISIENNNNNSIENKKIPVQISADDQSINLSSLPIMSPYERYGKYFDY